MGGERRGEGVRRLPNEEKEKSAPFVSDYTLHQLFPSTDPKQNLFYVCYGFVYRLNFT